MTRDGPAGTTVEELDLRRLARLLGRAARLRCPNCGARGLFRHWLAPRRTCPGCGLMLDRDEPDYFIGGYIVNFIVAELIAASFLAAAVVLSWPDVPWRTILYAGAALMVAAPLGFFPFSRTFWLAIDLAFRPPGASDFVAHAPPPVAGPAARLDTRRERR